MSWCVTKVISCDLQFARLFNLSCFFFFLKTKENICIYSVFYLILLPEISQKKVQCWNVQPVFHFACSLVGDWTTSSCFPQEWSNHKLYTSGAGYFFLFPCEAVSLCNQGSKLRGIRGKKELRLNLWSNDDVLLGERCIANCSLC